MFSPQKKAFGVFLGFKNLDLNISPIFQLIKKIKAASHKVDVVHIRQGHVL